MRRTETLAFSCKSGNNTQTEGFPAASVFPPTQILQLPPGTTSTVLPSGRPGQDRGNLAANAAHFPPMHGAQGTARNVLVLAAMLTGWSRELECNLGACFAAARTSQSPRGLRTAFTGKNSIVLLPLWKAK